MPANTSRISSFHKLSREERLERVFDLTGISSEERSAFSTASAPLGEIADHLSENVIGTMNVPLGIATNMIVDGVDVLVPMATEESSVIAAVCNGARQCRESGGITTSKDQNCMIGQIQITGLSNPFAARAAVFEHQDEIKYTCDECDPLLVQLGGGFRQTEVRVLDTKEPILVVHIIVDCRDAMGANTVNTMVEALAGKMEVWTGGKVELRILSNLADRRLVRASAIFLLSAIGGKDTRDGIIRAGKFAVADPYRATTHNKGIMNGISAVVLATGNDTRAVEAGAHAFAARSGQYSALTRWEKNTEGDLVGTIEVPMPVGIVGGATKVHPTAQLAMKIMDITTANRLASIIAAVGLIQNFSALKALATEGIQRGHMSLHANNVALAAGAIGEEIEILANMLVEQKNVRIEAAEKLLTLMRA
jgi:hydroxymethylglutaryl-CoA reductase